MYQDNNNLYGQAMSQVFSVVGFEQKKRQVYINDKLIHNFGQYGDKGNIIEADAIYFKKLHELHNNLTFLRERKMTEKYEKFVSNLQNKRNIKAHKKVFNHGLKLQQVHRVTESNQNAWLKRYIDLNMEMTARSKLFFEKNFLKLINNSVFGKSTQNQSIGGRIQDWGIQVTKDDELGVD